MHLLRLIRKNTEMKNKFTIHLLRPLKAENFVLGLRPSCYKTTADLDVYMKMQGYIRAKVLYNKSIMVISDVRFTRWLEPNTNYKASVII